MVTVLGAYWLGAWAGHGTCAVLVRDGKVLAAVSEERITRVKYDQRPPVNAIKEVLRISGTAPSTVDAVTVPIESPTKGLLRAVQALDFSGAAFRNLANTAVHFPYTYGASLLAMKNFLRRVGIDCPVHFVNHHECHAASCFYLSGMKTSTILTMDGMGDIESSTISLGAEEGLKRLAWSSAKHSLGHVYEELTLALGFKLNDGEGKVMGLAGYGDPAKAKVMFSNLMQVNGLEITGNPQPYETEIKIDYTDGRQYMPYRYTSYLNNRFAGGARQHKSEDVAAAGQTWLEEIASTLAKNAVSTTQEPNLCLAGGVALNVKMNKRIRETDGVGDVWIQPAAGDDGSCLGAALIVCRELMLDKGAKPTFDKMEDTYLGTRYTREEVERSIGEYGLRYERVNNPGKAAADFITEGKVIGWFQGAMEYGPRALGNRSVLADPRNPHVRERINNILKKRDWFMPFAPSILDESKEEYLVNPTEAPFMIMAFDVIEGMKKEIPAVVHVDGTARPQTVKRNVNPRFWELIKQFEQNTGVPVVLNTSFNRHGLPIVRSPEDALNHLCWGCVDLLVIEDYAVQRQFA